MDTYRTILKNGPFPNSIDFWAEDGRYFQQIHSGIIGHLLDQIQDPLLDMGYVAGKEISLQIAAGREPDLFVQRTVHTSSALPQRWDYVAAAEAVAAQVGVEMADRSLQGIHIRELKSGSLVTIVEIISPRNKQGNLQPYLGYRADMLRQDVNMVEVDLTRSVKRLVNYSALNSPYHVAVYLPTETPRVIEIGLHDMLPRCALPLRKAVVPIELQTAYRYAYQSAAIAVQIEDEIHYDLAQLPFPSLLTEAQQSTALNAVAAWRIRLREHRAQG